MERDILRIGRSVYAENDSPRLDDAGLRRRVPGDFFAAERRTVATGGSSRALAGTLWLGRAEPLALDAIFDPNQNVLPDFANLTLQGFGLVCETNLAALASAIEAVTAQFARPLFCSNWENTVAATSDILLALRRMDDLLEPAKYKRLYASEPPLSDEDYDKMVNALRQKVKDVQNRLLQDTDYYQALLKLEVPARRLDADEQARIVAFRLHQAKWAGAGLEPVAKARFKELQQQWEIQAAQFDTNLAAAPSLEAVRFSNAAQLAGVPASVTQEWRVSDAPTEEWLMPLSDGNAAKVFLNGTDRTERQRVQEAVLGRTATNTPVMAQMLALQQEWAQIFGFDSYAELVNVQKSTFASVAASRDFLTGWVEALQPVMAEKAQAYKLALQQDGRSPESFALWDTRYYPKAVSASASPFKPDD